MSRDDLLNTNYKIMQDVVAKITANSPNAILIVVSNPLDAMAQAAYKLSKFSRNRVLGMAGVQLLKPSQYMDKWRLDRTGVLPVNNSAIKSKLGFKPELMQHL